MDQDHSPESRELLSEFQGSGRFIIAGEPQSDAAMQGMLDRGQVDAWFACCPDSRATSRAGRTTSVQVLLDGTNSNTASHGFKLRQLRPSPAIRAKFWTPNRAS
jgi:ABC-2 type transport system permease protein